MKSIKNSLASLRYRVSAGDIKAIYACALIDIALTTAVIGTIVFLLV